MGGIKERIQCLLFFPQKNLVNIFETVHSNRYHLDTTYFSTLYLENMIGQSLITRFCGEM